MGKQKLLAVVGPTASGKTELAIALAKQFHGEIISADSRQVYRGMDIGTGKANRAQRREVRHHLLDVEDPNKQFSVAQYRRLAAAAINDILKREKLPILVGGTGLYVSAVLGDVSFPEVPPNPALRRRLEKLETPTLFRMLQRLHSRRARMIDPKNPRRLIRAIEIAQTIGPVPPLPRRASPYDLLLLGITVPREKLRRRIRDRLLARLQRGLITEVRRLKAHGLSSKRLEGFGLEYRYVNWFLKGKLLREEMIKELETAIWQYSRHQMTWFRRDSRIHWTASRNAALKIVRTFLGS